MGDGHLGKCKECTKRDVMFHREKNLARIREYDRDRYRQSPLRQQQMRRLLDGRDMRRARANQALSNAIRDRRVVRAEACWHCGSKDRIEGHHVSYDMPLDVVWLCRSCHCKIHRNHALLNG
jgi:hypothetical protein